MQDDDPYVRKTAVVCVAKLYDIAPELVEDRGFLETLQVPMPSANVVTYLGSYATSFEQAKIATATML